MFLDNVSHTNQSAGVIDVSPESPAPVFSDSDTEVRN